MTLAITLVAQWGTWASVDHRLTEHPSGKLITDSSVKHFVTRNRDGGALISYTGLGRVGRLDLSAWVRGVLRGENRTVDETLIDLREQATARLGLYAHSYGIPHFFLAGAFLQGHPWAIEVKNTQPSSALGAGPTQPSFRTSAENAAKEPILLVGGSGRDAITPADAKLLEKVFRKRPRQPEEFMQLLADVNFRAAKSRHAASKTISASCTVVYMPPSGDGVKHQWYGPEAQRPQAPQGFSHIAFGLDLEEVAKAGRGFLMGKIPKEDLDTKAQQAAERALRPQGRTVLPPS